MLYKALGFAVWKGAKWYVGRKVPPRKRFLGGVLALTVATFVAVGVRRDTDD